MYEPPSPSTVLSCPVGQEKHTRLLWTLNHRIRTSFSRCQVENRPNNNKSKSASVCPNAYLKSNTCERLWQRASAAWWTFSTRLRKVCRGSFGYLCKYLHAVLIWLVSKNGHLARTLTIAARAKLTPIIWMGVHEEYVNTVSTSGLPSRMQIFKQDAVS